MASDYNTLLSIKRSIADDFINPSNNKKARVFAATSPLINLSSMHVRTVREIKQGMLGIGITRVSGEERSLKIFIQNNLMLPDNILLDYFGLQNIPVQFKRARPLQFQLSTTQLHRPPFPGVSVGHYKGPTGTFGAVVKDAQGTRFILGNNHILANGNKGKKGDPILQPGPLDAGSKDDTIAHLHDFIPIKMGGVNFMDAGIATLAVDVPTTGIPYCGPIKSVGAPQIDTQVKKYGRTTQGKSGVIITTDVDIQVLFNQTLVNFSNIFEIKGVYESGRVIPFSEGGDSGSLVVAHESCEAVGLLFAGNEGETSFACSLLPVLEELKVVLI